MVPVIYLGTALVGSSSPPSFELSSATSPSAFAGPKATWLPPERIVLEPEVVPYGPPAASPEPPTPAVAAPAPRREEAVPEDAAKAAPGLAVPTTTTTTTRTEAALPATTTTVPPTTTTTTVAPLVTLPPALTPVAPAGKGTGTRTGRGKASWFHAPDGTCAHTMVPKGTEITVTRTSTGASVTCIVDDWGPADSSRIIDLSLDTFEQLASPDVGIIEVTIEW